MTGHRIGRLHPTVSAMVLCAALLFAPAAGDAGEGTPVVSWLHTLSIHVRSHGIHDALHPTMRVCSPSMPSCLRTARGIRYPVR